MSALARIDTASLSVGSRTLPAPTADAAPVQVDVHDPRVGPVRITYEIMQHKRGRNSHVFWIAVDAVQIDTASNCISPTEIDTSSTHLGHVQSYASPSFTLAVCGGRDFDDEEWAFRCLDRVHAKRPVTMLIEGCEHMSDPKEYGREVNEFINQFCAVDECQNGKWMAYLDPAWAGRPCFDTAWGARAKIEEWVRLNRPDIVNQAEINAREALAYRRRKENANV